MVGTVLANSDVADCAKSLPRLRTALTEYLLFNLSSNRLLVDLFLLMSTSVGQSTRLCRILLLDIIAQFGHVLRYMGS